MNLLSSLPGGAIGFAAVMAVVIAFHWGCSWAGTPVDRPVRPVFEVIRPIPPLHGFR